MICFPLTEIKVFERYLNNMPRRDRQFFQEIILSNGLKVYLHWLRLPWVYGRIIVPVGTANNTGEFLPGTAHFFEHLTFRRSARFLQANSFWKEIARLNADANAGTGDVTTTFEVDAPSQTFLAAWRAMQSTVFEPLFMKQDIRDESPIILQEWGRYAPYYPGDNPTNQYLRTNWSHNQPFTLRQTFGNEDDHQALTTEDLARMHRTGYLSRQCKVVIVGGIREADLTKILDDLSDLPLADTSLPQLIDPFRWVRRELHTHHLPDIGRPTYVIGGVIPFQNGEQPDLGRGVALGILLDYLWSTFDGPLFDWLRWQNGWIYDVHTGMHQDWRELGWYMALLLQSEEQVHTVRGELWSRVESALADKKRLRVAVNRHIAGQVLHYVDPHEIVKKAVADLEIFGAINTERQAREELVHCRNPEYLKEVYREVLRDSKNTGEVCLLPMVD